MITDKKKALIIERKQELIKKYGPNPTIYSSGTLFGYEKEMPKKIKLALNRKVLEECYPESE